MKGRTKLRRERVARGIAVDFWATALLAVLFLAAAPGSPMAAEKPGAEARSLDRQCARELESGSPRLALILCERRAHLPGADAPVYRRLGDAYAANGLSMEAKAAYRRAIQLGGDPEDLRAMIAVADRNVSLAQAPQPAWTAQETEAAPETSATVEAAPVEAALADEPLAEEGPVPEEGRIAVASLTPPQEPAYLPVAVAAPPPEESAPEALPTPEPETQQPAASQTASLPGGAFRIQLASLTSRTAAEQQAGLFQGRFPQLLAGLSPAHPQIEIEGRGLFHRVQFEGLESREAALTLCGRFKTLGQDCFVPRG